MVTHDGTVVLLASEPVGAFRTFFAEPATSNQLTRRECEVLSFIAAGRTACQIAGELQLTPATVRSHAKNAYQKLGTSKQSAAVAEALRRGLIV